MKTTAMKWTDEMNAQSVILEMCREGGPPLISDLQLDTHSVQARYAVGAQLDGENGVLHFIDGSKAAYDSANQRWDVLR